MVEEKITAGCCIKSISHLSRPIGKLQRRTAQEVIDQILACSNRDFSIKFRRTVSVKTRQTESSWEFKGDIEHTLIQLICQYNESIEAARDNDAKIKAILTFCRNAAILHPFPDGNGRLFCMLLQQRSAGQMDSRRRYGARTPKLFLVSAPRKWRLNIR